VVLPPSALPRTAHDELVAIVGAAHVSEAHDDRVRHARGRSTVDLLELRAGIADAPDAVVRPADHDQVLALLRTCAASRVAVVPFGGGTSVVGALSGVRAPATISLHLSRVDGLIGIDTVSRTATFGAGVRAPEAERLLAAHGFTLGHYPQSFEYATIGGFAATRSAGQYSAGYGRFDEMVVALTVATPEGSVSLGRAPRSAAGPDLRQLFLGSEGVFGVITSVTVCIRPFPAERACDGWGFENYAAGMGALRQLAQDGPVPTMLRLSDEYETVLNASASGPVDAACLAVVGYETPRALRERPEVEAVLRAAGGVKLDGDVGERWRRGRFAAPYLRDALLDAGALVETVETATFWSGLPGLYEAVRTSLLEDLAAQGTPPLVGCHISHVYAAGASLYFTVVCAQADDPVAQWRRAKAAVTAAVLGAGGTVTHHHAVGRDHAAGLGDEIGPLGLAILSAVKERLDPSGVMNPGVLV
jgi:alkyldihydroxyacetonephosphate synthase